MGQVGETCPVAYQATIVDKFSTVVFQLYRKRKDSADSEWHFNTQCLDWPEVDYVQSRYLPPEEREHICLESKRLEAKMFPLPPWH